MNNPQILSYLAVIGTSPFLEQAVEYLKDQWRLPVRLAALTALLLGILAQVVTMIYTHIATGSPLDFLTATMVGLITGFTTSYWHEVTNR